MAFKQRKAWSEWCSKKLYPAACAEEIGGWAGGRAAGKMLWLIRGARRKLTGSLVFFFKKLYLFIFTWLMIILQYWFDFCYTQHELAIGIHMSPPSWTFLPPPTPWPESWRLRMISPCRSGGHVPKKHLVGKVVDRRQNLSYWRELKVA